MNQNKKTTITIITVLIIVIGIGGFFFGKNINKQETEKLQEVVNVFYPEPPEVINNVSAVITNIRGATIQVEIDDPEDYLPDNTDERNKLTKFVSVSENTKITEFVYSEETQNFQTREITIDDLQEEDEVSITTNQNIRDVDKIEAQQIEVFRQ